MSYHLNYTSFLEGAFLLMLNTGSLSIWDLLDIQEATDPANMDRQPIASVDSFDRSSFTTHPTPDGSGIIIITTTHNGITIRGDTGMR